MTNKTQIKYIIVSMCFLLVSFVMKAQDNRAFRFGFKVSPNLTWTKAKEGNFSNGGTGVGFSYGLMGDIRLADNYALSTEFLVTSMQSKIESKAGEVFRRNNSIPSDTTAYTNLEYTYSIKYIQIPVAIKFKTKEIGAITYWGQFGIIPGFSIGNNVKAKARQGFGIDEKYNPNNDANNKYDFQGYYDDNVNALRLSMLIGLGIEYRISGNTALSAGLRFDNGFTDFLNDKKTSMINNALGLHVGVFF